MSWPWDTLGIGATGDRAAIRRAYAGRLKAMDADADVAGFARLRAARDAALGLAASGAWSEAPTEEADEDWLSEGEAAVLPPIVLAPERIAPTSPEPAPPEPIAAPEPAIDYNAHAARLWQVLAPGEERGELDADELATASADLTVLLADPRLEGIGFLADAEPWFADLLAGAIPRSDPLLETVAARFGWRIEAERIGEAAAIARINRRRGAFAALARLERRDHPFHREWRELTKPATERSWRDRRLRRAKVLELLKSIREEQPELEGNLDPWRVSLWTKPPRKLSWMAAGAILWIVVQVVAHILPDDRASVPTTTPAAFQLVDQDQDIGLALEAVAGPGLTTAMLEADNPALMDRLVENWRLADQRGDPRATFVAAQTQLLGDRVEAGLATAPYADVAEGQRIVLARLQAAVRDGQCGAVVGDTGRPPPLPPALRARQQALAARVLAGVTPDAPVPPLRRSVRLPGGVVADTRRLSGLDADALTEALNDRGAAGPICRARIALIEAVLALPKQRGLPLLRRM